MAQEAATAAETAALAAAAARQFAKEAAASAQQAELAAAAAAAAVATGVMIIDDVDDCSLADVPRGASPANASLAPARIFVKNWFPNPWISIPRVKLEPRIALAATLGR